MPAHPVLPRFDSIQLPSRLRLEDGSINATFDVGHLRPQEVDETEDDILVVLTELPEGGTLRGTWTATSTSVDGVLRGELSVSVDASPLTAGELLQSADDHRAVTRRGRR